MNEATERLASPQFEDSPDYRPPSIADGTVAQGLIEGLSVLADAYGAAGVCSALDELLTRPSLRGAKSSGG